MELLKQSAGDKFAYIGMVMEFAFLYEVFKAFWKTLYANLLPDDIINSLGMQRALTFKLLSPEEIDRDYVYEPQGIFTMENKSFTQQRLQAIYAQFANQPWMDHMAFFDKEVKANNFDPDGLKLSPEDMQAFIMSQNMMAQATAPLPEPPMPPGAPK